MLLCVLRAGSSSLPADVDGDECDEKIAHLLCRVEKLLIKKLFAITGTQSYYLKVILYTSFNSCKSNDRQATDLISD